MLARSIARNLRGVAWRHIFFIARGTPSEQAFILVDHTGERTVLWKRDGRLTLLPEELNREWIVNARALHVDGHDTAAATQAAQWAREASIPVLADLDDNETGGGLSPSGDR